MDRDYALALLFGTKVYDLALVTEHGDRDTPGAEVTGGGYARIPITLDDADTGDGPVGVTVTTGSAYTIVDMPAASIVGFELWDPDTDQRAFYGPFMDAPIEVNTGDTFTLEPTAIAVGILALGV